MNIVSIVGARPQFIKAAAVSRVLRREHREILVHTGQHYDYAMSGVFFDGLDLPAPDVNLGVGSGSHGAQTAKMLSGIEQVLAAERPDALVIYGDTNSTLAGALAAAKRSIPIAHVEAGLRSFNRRMPEEINRVVADHLSALLLCPSETAVANLNAEGIAGGIYVVGDVMLDVLDWARNRIQSDTAGTAKRLGLSPKSYVVATVHRSENTDDPSRFCSILTALNTIAEPIVFPVHPRSRGAMDAIGWRPNPNVHLVDPLGYLEMVGVSRDARLIVTDSGGLQKEAYWLGVPCVTLRDETEWVETVGAGWNVLAGAQTDRIVAAVGAFTPACSRPPLYGDGRAAESVVDCLALCGESAETVSSRRAMEEADVISIAR